MEIKVCNKCEIGKNICEFYKNKDSSDGLRSNCKECQNKNSTKWRKNNPKQYKNIQKKFLEKNPGIYYEYKKKWINKNKDRVREYHSNYSKDRYHYDILFKIKTNYRNRLKDVFRNTKLEKKNRSIEYLGCNIEFLKNYLENQCTNILMYWLTNLTSSQP